MCKYWILFIILCGSLCEDIHVSVNDGQTFSECGSQRSPCASIQSAVSMANSSETVVILHPGRYKGPGNVGLLVDGKSVMIKSLSGPSQTVIDCEDNSRGFVFRNSPNELSTVQGLQFTNCRVADSGAAILCQRTLLSVVDCVFRNNHAPNAGGGAIFWSDVRPSLSECSFSDNSAAYGHNIASEASRIALSEIERSQTSGKPLADVIAITVRDAYNHLVTTAAGSVEVFVSDQPALPSDDASPVQLGDEVSVRNEETWPLATFLPGSKPVFSPLRATLAHGEAKLINSVVTAVPGSVVSFFLVASILPDSRLKSDAVTVSLKMCVRGEEVVRNVCVACAQGYYNDFPAHSCHPCPVGVSCEPVDQIRVLPGYTQDSRVPLIVRRCPMPNTCLGGPSGFTMCATGFRGPVCDLCMRGSVCLGECKEGVCWTLVMGVLAASLFGVCLVVAGVAFIRSTEENLRHVLLVKCGGKRRRSNMERKRLINNDYDNVNETTDLEAQSSEWETVSVSSLRAGPSLEEDSVGRDNLHVHSSGRSSHHDATLAGDLDVLGVLPTTGGAAMPPTPEKQPGVLHRGDRSQAGKRTTKPSKTKKTKVGGREMAYSALPGWEEEDFEGL